MRTRFFDDWALKAVNESGARQLVLLGAGMDTRAFRLPWPPGLRFFEIDAPELFAQKEARLRSAGVRVGIDRVVVEADLTSRSWVRSLLRLGFDKDTPTVWLAEGLFQYLTPKDVKQILAGAASVSAPGSSLGAEIISEEYLRRPSNRAALKARKERGTPWAFGTNNPGALLLAHGWVLEGKIGSCRGDVAWALAVAERWSHSPLSGRARPTRVSSSAARIGRRRQEAI